jgi:SulP family sulfate permease
MKIRAHNVKQLVATNWKSGLTVALISVPLSIALSISSGAGPLPGLITGIWATGIAALFCSNNYNIIGAAGALTTVLFAAQLEAAHGLGPAILPLLAIATGLILFVVWLVGASKFLYFIPSSVMYGFAAGVAISIAAGQLFDATGLLLKRTGSFLGDTWLFAQHIAQINTTAFAVFAISLALILILKRYVKRVPAIIPVAILGIFFGFAEKHFFPLNLQLLSDKFGTLHGTLAQPPHLETLAIVLRDHAFFFSLFQTAALIAVIAILETLITARLADKITRTESSSGREIFGLALANIGSGVMGGLPATGVFIRTGANIKAGATHRTSALIAALLTAVITLVVLPFFSYLPAAVVAAMLVNTAIGLIEVSLFRELWHFEKSSFWIMVLVAAVTVVRNAGDAVAVGAGIALFLFINRISHGRFDVWYRFADGTTAEEKNQRTIHFTHGKKIEAITYSLAGHMGYIDAGHHAANFRHLAHSSDVGAVIVRIRNLFSIDHEGREMLGEAMEELMHHGKKVYISSASEDMVHYLTQVEPFAAMQKNGQFAPKASEALTLIRA